MILTKILSAEQNRAADAYTIANEPIDSIDLMERASLGFVDWFINVYDNQNNIKVFCGIGNNGGDGLAISRLLINAGYSVEVFVIGDLDNASNDFLLNHKRLESLHDIRKLFVKNNLPILNDKDVVVDGLFGSGLNRPIEGIYADIIYHINHSNCKSVVSIDIPSGLFSDKSTPESAIIKASQTVTFQAPKLAFFLPQSAPICGNHYIVDIGLDQSYIGGLPSNHFLINRAYIRSIFKKRTDFIHKGEAGKCLIIAGSRGKIGAGMLAAKACLRAGAGLVTIHTPRCGYIPFQTAIPEVMIIEDKDENIITDIGETDKYDAIGIGPGIGNHQHTIDIFEQFLKTITKPIVIDADALNILSSQKKLFDYIPRFSIITPHPGEFKRLVGNWQDDFERLKLQIELSKKYQMTVLLKGAYTSITSPEGNVFFNPTGNSGMATAGSGDVLTGIITALLGQGYKSQDATILGAYIHGLSGDIFAEKYAKEGLIARDLIKNLPRTFRLLNCV